MRAAGTACPGAASELAGRAAACEGCPNAALCASGEAARRAADEGAAVRKLSGVRNIIVVASGKGGVGKSTVACTLAREFVRTGFRTGLLDLDICGPSVPSMTGTRGASVQETLAGWSPVLSAEGIKLMSIEYLLERSSDAVIWRGPKKGALIRQFLENVDWGELDMLLIDTPPGTSDEHLSLAQLLKHFPRIGALVVGTPQKIAIADVEKEVGFLRAAELPIIGVVENMADS
uniref:Cytosolic Fe-S cluster assembly factor NUBP1 homolog n=1 Tax=Dermatophagoides pteronyssinus TaxID=6956 RepID=A0A6P6YKJ4_DERPT